MRCPDCSKFVSFEQSDPEVEFDLQDQRTEPAETDPPTDQDVEVTVQARLVLACAECGTELKEASLEDAHTVTITGHVGDGHGLEVEETSSDTTDRYDGKPGTPSRYRRHYYGATVGYQVLCECSPEALAEGQFELEESASGFDELV